MAEETYGADDWVTTHLATVERLEQLVSILNDQSIADGAVIQLTSSHIFTSSKGALLDRLNVGKNHQGDVLEKTARKMSL